MSTQLDQFELLLQEQLLQICTTQGFIAERPLTCDDVEEKWEQIAPEYMQDAVPEMAQYPTVAIAWAAFMGMGMVVLWDDNWEQYANTESFYRHFCTPRGFDCMDEHIMEDYLQLAPGSDHSEKLIGLLRQMAQYAYNLMRKEQVEPQSREAFFLFARTARLFYHLGVSIGLTQLGYRYRQIGMQ